MRNSSWSPTKTRRLGDAYPDFSPQCKPTSFSWWLFSDQILKATESGALQQPFTTEQLKEWMQKFNIIKDDGGNYAEASINAILSNSDQANSPTTNLNRKVLSSRINPAGKKEYFFYLRFLSEG